MIKKLFSALAAAILALAPLVGLSANAEVPSGLSENGTFAVQQLASCIRTASSLDVYYVIDNSRSLEETDPEVMRADIIAQDVIRWGDLTDLQKNLKVRINGTFFSETTSDFKGGWRDINFDNKESVSENIKSDVVSHVLGNGTDWLAALTRAESVLAKSEASCKAVVWFTDGGLWVGEDRSGNLSAISQLCGVDVPQSGALPNETSATGLMQRLRDENVTVFGVLLNTQASGNSGTAEAYWRSYMRNIVEETGPVIPSNGSAPSGDFTCGVNAQGEDVTYAKGAYLDAASPGEVAYPFMLIASQIAGGNLFDVDSSGNFWVDPAFKKLEILTLDDEWSIENADGEVVLSSQDAHPVASTGLIDVSVVEPEQWHFSGSGELILYVSLAPELDPKTIFVGRPASISGHFIDATGLPADLSKFTGATLTAKINRQQSSTEFNSTTGVFAFDVPNVTEEINQFVFALGLSTEHYQNIGPFEFRVFQTAQNPAFYPSVSEITFDRALTSGTDQITSNITITGPSAAGATQGEVCFNKVEIIADQQNEVGAYESRQDTWKTELAGTQDKNCVLVAAGEQKTVSLQVSNSVPKTSHVVGVAEYSLLSDAADTNEVQDSKQFQFDTGKQVDVFKELLIFIIAYVISIGIPLIVLYLLNRSAAKIQHGSEVMRASFPVEIDMNTGSITATSGKPLNSAEIGMNEFSYRPPMDASLSFADQELGTLKAVVPWFPLITPWYEVVTNNDSVVITGLKPNKSKEARYALGNRGMFEGDLSKLWAVVLPKSAFKPTSQAAANPLPPIPGAPVAATMAASNTGKVNGRLVVYARTGKGGAPKFPELMTKATMRFTEVAPKKIADIKKAIEAEAKAKVKTPPAKNNPKGPGSAGPSTPPPPGGGPKVPTSPIAPSGPSLPGGASLPTPPSFATPPPPMTSGPNLPPPPPKI